MAADGLAFPIGGFTPRAPDENIYDGKWHMVVVCACLNVFRAISLREDLPRICPECGGYAERFGTGRRRWHSKSKFWNPRSWRTGHWEAVGTDRVAKAATSAPTMSDTPHIERGRVIIPSEVPVEDEHPEEDEAQEQLAADVDQLSSDHTRRHS